MDWDSISNHMRERLRILLPMAASQNRVIPPNSVDLATAENWVLRSELVDLCKEAVAQKLTTKDFSYQPGFGGDLAVLEAFATFLNSNFRPSVKVLADHVATTSGAGNAIDALIHTICDDGDGVLIPGPCWSGYQALLRMHANVKLIVAEPSQFDDACTSAIIPALKEAYSKAEQPQRIKVLLLCNPHNPVGQCYPAEVIREIGAFCHERGLHLVSDEVYALSVLENSSTPFVSVLEALGAPASQREPQGTAEPIHPSRVHQVWSLSKDFGSSGIRMACVVSQANPLLLVGVKTSTYWQTSTLSNMYATALLESEKMPNLIALNTKRLTHGYDILTSALREWGVDFIPVSAGFLVFAKLAKNSTTLNEEENFVRKLRENGVLVAPGRLAGEFKGTMGWVRIQFSVPEETLRNGLDRIGKTLRSDSP